MKFKGTCFAQMVGRFKGFIQRTRQQEVGPTCSVASVILLSQSATMQIAQKQTNKQNKTRSSAEQLRCEVDPPLSLVSALDQIEWHISDTFGAIGDLQNWGGSQV